MKRSLGTYLFCGTLLLASSLVLTAVASARKATKVENPCCTLAKDKPILALSSVIGQLDPTQQEKSRLGKWKEFLSTVAKREDVCMVAPVATRNWPPNPFARKYGLTSLWMLGDLMGTRYSIQDGTVAFQVALDLPENSPGSGQAWVSDWLSNASDGEIAAATSKNGLSLGSIEPNERLSILARIGLYPEVLEGFVANGNETRMSLRFSVEAQGTDSNGKTFRFDLDPATTVDRSKEKSEPSTNLEIPADSLTGRNGELDFGSGQLMTVADLIGAASAKFEKQLLVDPRLDDSLLFLSGRYTFEKLVSAVKYALTVGQVKTPEKAPSLTQEQIGTLVENRLAGLLTEFTRSTGIDVRTAMDHRTVSASSIAANSVGFKGFLQSRGINPANLKITLVPKILFNVTAPGTSRGSSPNPSMPATTYHHSFTFSYPLRTRQ